MVMVFRFMAFSAKFILTAVFAAPSASVAFTPVAFLASLRSDWGSRPENGDANGSWPIWGIKFLRSGRVAFARWLSMRLLTDPRWLMTCEMNFCKNDGRSEEH